MAASVDLTTPVGQMMANIPDFAKENGYISVNGELLDPAQVLAINNNSFEMSMAYVFRALESDQLKSESIGKYSYERWGMRGSEWWRLQASSKKLGSSKPVVAMRRNAGRYPGWGGCW